MPDDVGILAAHHGKQGIRIDRDGGADASAADVDLVKSRSALVHDGRELLFMPMGCSRVDIAREGRSSFCGSMATDFSPAADAALRRSSSAATGIMKT